MLNWWLDGSVWEITLIDCSVVWISAEFFAPDSSPVPFPIFYQTYSWPGTATLLKVVWKTPLYRSNNLCIHSPESSGFPFWMRKTVYHCHRKYQSSGHQLQSLQCVRHPHQSFDFSLVCPASKEWQGPHMKEVRPDGWVKVKVKDLPLLRSCVCETKSQRWLILTQLHEILNLHHFYNDKKGNSHLKTATHAANYK